MTSQNVEAEHSFTSLPTSDSHRIAHNHWIQQTERYFRSTYLDNILGETKHGHDYFSPRDETLTDTLQELRQENVTLSQSLQRKEK